MLSNKKGSRKEGSMNLPEKGKWNRLCGWTGGAWDGNRGDQVGEGGMVGENTQTDDWNSVYLGGNVEA